MTLTMLDDPTHDSRPHPRADDRAEPIIQLSPPLIAGPEQFDEIAATLRVALTEAIDEMGR